MNIALFVGSDISSHILLNELIAPLLAGGYRPTVFLPRHGSARTSVLPELGELAFFERDLISSTVYPYLETMMPDHGIWSSPRLLALTYQIPVVEVENVNHPAFLRTLQDAAINVGVSIRCYQKFGRESIQLFSRRPNGAMWNLHPGILPGYRGVMTIFRSLLEGQRQVSYSLHVIDELWDAGPIIDIRPVPLDPAKAMLTTYCEIAATGLPIIIDNLNKLRDGDRPRSILQDAQASRYHTFPTRDEMDQFIGKGLKLVDHRYMRDLFVSRFACDVKHRSELGNRIDNAIDGFYRKNPGLCDQ